MCRLFDLVLYDKRRLKTNRWTILACQFVQRKRKDLRTRTALSHRHLRQKCLNQISLDTNLKMVSLFENYEQQYSVLTADITAQIGLLGASATKDRRQLISNIEKHVEEAQELLEQMDLEVREIESSKRQRCRTKLDCYRAELKRLTLDYIKARSIKQGALSYDSAEELNDVRISADQKQRLLDNSERIERTGRQLEEGYRVMIETQEIGTQVLQNLNDQRETIQRSRSRLRETDEELGRSSRLMSSMIMRSIQQKAILFIVGACFIIALSLGLYLGLSK